MPACSESTMLVLAVTLHNIPGGHGRGRGVCRSHRPAARRSPRPRRWRWSLGIAIQNFPEGAVISLPLEERRAWARGGRSWAVSLSGVVEPIGAGADHSGWPDLIVPALPYLLSLCGRSHALCGGGGADPGNPSEGEHSNIGTVRLCRGISGDDGAGRGTGIR